MPKIRHDILDEISTKVIFENLLNQPDDRITTEQAAINIATVMLNLDHAQAQWHFRKTLKDGTPITDANN